MSVNEKDSTKHHVDKTLSPSPTSVSSEVDDAWTFLDAHRDANIGDESVDILAIRRKIDYRVVPLGFLLYMMQFADKLVLNVSPRSELDGCLVPWRGGYAADLSASTVRRRHDNARGP